MAADTFPFPLDANGEPSPRPSACWWIPLPDPIGLADGREFHFHTITSSSDWPTDAPESLGIPAISKYDITFQIRQVDVPWKQSPGEHAAFQLAKLDQDSTDKSTPEKDSHGLAEAHTRRISIVRAAVSLIEESALDPDAISDAFDTAMVQLRRLQASYSLVSQWPMTFVTREILPMAIPYETFFAYEDESAERNLGVYHLNMSGIEQLAPSNILNIDEERALDIAIDRDHAAFASYHRLRHDASVSLKRRGDYRSSILSAPTCQAGAVPG